MGFFDVGSVPVFSTGAGTATNPSTTTLIAELDSTQLNSFSGTKAWPGQVTWIVGASTLATLVLEQATSTTIDSTTPRDAIQIQVPVNQSGQYMTKHRIEVGDRLRVRALSTFTGTAVAKIYAEPLT